MGYKYSDAQIELIVTERKKGATWADITEKLNATFDTHFKYKSVENAYHRYKGIEFGEDYYLKNLVEKKRQQERNKKLTKDNNVILKNLVHHEEVLEGIRRVLKSKQWDSLQVPPLPRTDSTNLEPMIIEALFSDSQYGKKTDMVGYREIRKRVRKYAQGLVDEIHDRSFKYNIKKVMCAFLGDIIESETMHGLESARGCDLSNSEQVMCAIESIFHDFLLPVYKVCATYEIPVEVICITGNHDRLEKAKTFQDPGKRNATWIIYNVVKDFFELVKAENITFEIPHKVYTTADIFGELVLYEHYDILKRPSKKDFIDKLTARSRQIGKLIRYIRGGHYHEYFHFERGTAIINPSICGIDSFSDIHGFRTEASQIINFYTKKGFRYSLPILLE